MTRTAEIAALIGTDETVAYRAQTGDLTGSGIASGDAHVVRSGRPGWFIVRDVETGREHEASVKAITTPAEVEAAEQARRVAADRARARRQEREAAAPQRR